MRTLARFAFSLAAVFCVLPLTASAQTAQGTAFTYQGQLLQNNAPVTGNTDMTFTLYDAATNGNVVGTPIALTGANAVAVVNGSFTVTLDFGGPAFFTVGDDARWLQVEVGTDVLSPRTKLENAPYALTSQLAYNVPAGSIGSAQIAPAQVQQRVSGVCASGAISTINQDGTVVCQTGGSGTITGVLTNEGSGLHGGGTSGTLTLTADTNILQQRITGNCPAGSSISAIAADGLVTCQAVGTTFTLPYSATQAYVGPLFDITNTDTSSASTALQGTSNSLATNVSAVTGIISSTKPGRGSAGVSGVNNGTASDGSGIFGSHAGSGAGVTGTSQSGAGLAGSSVNGYGVYATSANSTAAQFVNTNSSNANSTLNVSTNGVGGYGITGYSTETASMIASGTGIVPHGPTGIYGSAAAPVGVGMFGIATDTTGAPGGHGNFGVIGEADGPEGTGVAGFATSTGTAYGVFGMTNGTGAGVAANGGNNGTGLSVENNSPRAAIVALNSSGLGLELSGNPGATIYGNVTIAPRAPQNSAVELVVQGCCDASNPNADVQLQPYGTNYGFDISVGGTGASDVFFSIDKTDGSSYQSYLTVDANGKTYNTTGAWTQYSDRRLKRDIESIAHPLDTLLGLQGRSFEYIDPEQAHAQPGRRMGFIAQDVETVLPQWVSEDGRGYKMVTIQGFEALSVEALRELRAEKEAEIADLHARLERLEARLDAQQAQP